MKTALLGMALVAALSACADERPDALAAATAASPQGADDDAGSDGESDSATPADRDAYADALAATLTRSGINDLALPEDEAACVAEAVIDEVGLDTLQEHLTPEEIRESSDAATDLWDLDLTPEQGEAILDAMIECAPAVGEMLADALAQGMSFGLREDAEFEVDTTCLAEDTEAVRSLGALFLIQGDSFALDEEQAQLFYDWLAACADMRQLTVEVMLGEDIPETGATCIIERMDDDLLRRFWVEVMVNLEDLDALDESPILGELAVIFDACAESIDTTDI